MKLNDRSIEISIEKFVPIVWLFYMYLNSDESLTNRSVSTATKDKESIEYLHVNVSLTDRICKLLTR